MERFSGSLGTSRSLSGPITYEDEKFSRMTGMDKLRRKRNRKSRYKILQIKTFNLLERPSNSAALFYHGLVFVLILASLFLSVLITIPKYASDDGIHTGVYYLEVSLVIIFAIEYILRIWSCSCHGNYTGFWGKLRFIKKPYQVIDIIVIVATTVVVATSNAGDVNLLSVSMFRFLRFLQVLRILRLDRQRGAFKIVSHVIYEHRQELLTCWYMSFILLVACTFLVYLAEKSDDKPGEELEGGELDNLGDGLYWGIITLSTVGYGDFSPKNWVAKLIVCFFAFIGTAFFALPAGILGSGFALQVAQNQKQKHFNRRRVPAALVIQYAWRAYAAHPSRQSDVTWIPHQEVINPPKEKKFSVYTKTVNSPSQTPTTGRRSMAFIRRKLNASRIQSYIEGDTLQSRRSSIGATIPTALELRDRCQSEGNLLLVSPNNVDDNQATIVSLPPQHFDEGFYDKNHDTINERFFSPHYYNQRSSAVEIQLKPLLAKEKDCIRFIRKVKLFICIRKFKEECRPYDVKDVLEQYSSGQADLFSFFKKFQQNVEGFLGISAYHSIKPENSLMYRVSKMEQKVSSIDEKLDMIVRLLENRNRPAHSYQPNMGGGGGRDDHYSHASQSIDIPLSGTSTGGSRAEYEDGRQRKRGTTFEKEELTRRLELLKDEMTTGEEKRRAESRFTVTPSFLETDHNLSREAIIDINSSPENEKNKKSEDSTPQKGDDIPLCDISNLKKFESVPNLQKEQLDFGDIRRSSSVHFDESSFVKRRSSTVSVYNDPKEKRTTACGNPYVSDVESDSNSSKTTSPKQGSSTNSPTSILKDPSHLTDNQTTSIDRGASILKRYGLDAQRQDEKPKLSAGSDSALATEFRPQEDMANGSLSKSTFELNC